jgi:hypothetical protein
MARIHRHQRHPVAAMQFQRERRGVRAAYIEFICRLSPPRLNESLGLGANNFRWTIASNAKHCS